VHLMREKLFRIGSIQFASKSAQIGLLQQPPAQLSWKTTTLSKAKNYIFRQHRSKTVNLELSACFPQ
jgi:hypothetical protein